MKPSTHVKTEQQNKAYIQTISHKTDRHNMSYDNKTDPLPITALPAYRKMAPYWCTTWLKLLWQSWKISRHTVIATVLQVHVLCRPKYMYMYPVL